MADNSLFYRLPAARLLAITAYGEAGNQGNEGMAAVLNVIKNRSMDPDQFADRNILAATGSVYHAVILKPYQFSMYNDNDPVRQVAVKLAQDFDNQVNRIPAIRTAYMLANSMLIGQLEDNTYGADFYFNPAYANPSWARQFTLVANIGDHVFYSSTGGTMPTDSSGDEVQPGEEEVPTEEVPIDEQGTVQLAGMSTIGIIALIGIAIGLLWRR